MSLRKTHSLLYYLVSVVALIQVALSLNFWLSRPAFNPYDISKNIIGFIFAAFGISQLFLLNALRNFRKLRILLTFSIVFMFAWGLANTQQVFDGNASMQLPILFLGICAIQVLLVIYAPVTET